MKLSIKLLQFSKCNCNVSLFTIDKIPLFRKAILIQSNAQHRYLILSPQKSQLFIVKENIFPLEFLFLILIRSLYIGNHPFDAAQLLLKISTNIYTSFVSFTTLLYIIFVLFFFFYYFFNLRNELPVARLYNPRRLVYQSMNILLWIKCCGYIRNTNAFSCMLFALEWRKYIEKAKLIMCMKNTVNIFTYQTQSSHERLKQEMVSHSREHLLTRLVTNI